MASKSTRKSTGKSLGKPQGLANLTAVMRATKTARIAASVDTTASTTAIRNEIADFCRYLGARLRRDDLRRDSGPALPAGVKLSPRMRQTLDRLLVGDSEKQIAARLSVSRHTIHVYIKALYRSFDVTSRGELLAHFVRIPPPPAVQPRRGRPPLGKP